MFVANKDYMHRATLTVRMHGDSQFSQGGSAADVLVILKKYGICPENAMALPGTMTGDSLANFNEFFSVMEPYVAAVSKSKEKNIQPVEERPSGHHRLLPWRMPGEVCL